VVIMKWSEFEQAAPDLARRGEGLLRTSGLCVIATLRRDGWPRISPCEVIFDEGELLLGMMWLSRKALDLQRDPRLTVHSPQCDPQAAEGDFKAYGRAREIPDDGVDPTRPRPSHLFAVEIERAAFISFGAERLVVRWDPVAGSVDLRHPGG
jgi:hypothetical protein